MENMIHVMIVEDESIVAMDLADGLERDGYKIAAIADSYEEAIELFKQVHVDILLMDIQISGDRDGVETAAELMKIRQVPLIYLTAFTDAATIERVKHTNPSAFLMKPYDINNVRIAIDLALHNFAMHKPDNGESRMFSLQSSSGVKKSDKDHLLQLNEYLFIKQQYKFVKFKLSDMLYAEADNNYVHIHTSLQKFTLRLSLSDLIERLHFSRLIRIHRSYAINLDAIVSFDEQSVKLQYHELPVGRNYRQEFLDRFNWR